MRGSISQEAFVDKLRIVMGILRQNLGHCLAGIVKKCVFLHTFMRTAADVGFYTERISEVLNVYLKEILEQDIPTINMTKKNMEVKKQKKEGSLTKLYNRVVRSFS